MTRIYGSLIGFGWLCSIWDWIWSFSQQITYKPMVRPKEKISCSKSIWGTTWQLVRGTGWFTWYCTVLLQPSQVVSHRYESYKNCIWEIVPNSTRSCKTAIPREVSRAAYWFARDKIELLEQARDNLAKAAKWRNLLEFLNFSFLRRIVNAFSYPITRTKYPFS